MKNVLVFDIATETWFSQSTTTTTTDNSYPGGRVRFCAVVASAEDNSSHNIYIYGGMDGSSKNMADIWVLTLPEFRWIPVYPSTDEEYYSSFGWTSGHRCHKVHEKHMVAYRGQNQNFTCDNDKRVEKFQGMTIYDMSALKWTTKVEVGNQRYLVPEELYNIIGGG